MKKRIEIQTKNPSKIEEVNVVRKLMSDLMGTDTYLASLFTCDLAGWVETQIMNDFPPDIWGAYQAEVQDLKRRLNDANKATTIFQSEALEARKEVEAAGRKVESLQEDLRIAEDLRAQESAKAGEIHEELEDAQADLRNYERQLEERDQEITKLKAALYDAMVS